MKFCLGIVFAVIAALSMSAAATAQEKLFAGDPKTRADLHASGIKLPATSFKVIGNFSSTSIWNFGQYPFWAQDVGELTDGKLKISLSSLTELNFKGPEVIRLMQQGLADFADLVANYASADVMELDAMDLAGAMPNIDSAIRGMKAYAPVVAEAVKRKLGAVVLGLGPANAQIFWCNVEINGLSDLKGKRIRTSSATTADLVRGLGGTPVSTPGSEMVTALQRGVVDCAITGVLAGNTLKLHEVTTHLYPLVVGWAAWLRVANARTWERADPAVKQWLQEATDTLYSQRVIAMVNDASDQGIWCSTGDSRCTYGEKEGISKGHMKLVPVTDADKKELARIMETSVLPRFAASCGPDCTKAWNETIGKELSLVARP